MARRQSAIAAISLLGSSPDTFIRSILQQVRWASALLARRRARGRGIGIGPVAGPPVDGPARVVGDLPDRRDRVPLGMAVHVVGVDAVGMDGDRIEFIPPIIGPGAAP